MVFLCCRDVDGDQERVRWRDHGWRSSRPGLLSILLSTLRSNCMVLDRLNGQYGLRSETVKSLLDS